jgi:CHAT domain-containing protein
MVTRASIINLSGEHEETVERLAKHLGRNKLRRKLFNAVYGPGRRSRSKKQIMVSAGIAARDAQQAQNQIDHLATHHLIVREENDGSVSDKSRYLYRKDESIRAIRKELVKYADDTKARDSLPTKRRPAVTIIGSVRTVNRQTLKKKKHLSVLYLTADSSRRHRLRVDAEMRRVREAIRGSRYRDNITVNYSPAAGLRTLQDGLNDYRPQIVHFSGHGSTSGIAMDNGKAKGPAVEALSFSLLAKALAATDSLPAVVVLNACNSSGAKNALLKLGIIVVSMKTSISDLAAITFAPRFYAAIASGQSIRSSFAQGKVRRRECIDNGS